MMAPADEAAAILIRMFDTLASGMGKRLKDSHKIEIRRACELLAADGNLTPLDDMPRTTPGERVPVSDYATVPPEVDRWRRTQRRNEDV